ncbi:MOSC domain-containing protein [Qipengyuania aurantiaca]|uniref:MOSC domain-containing protein n=1 Tax=Qipengyuania aurantiaca TaxID=2867233 RepID=A0ABX8ZKE2_9SPHN|nr:MOSC domain-containing protein [Qipengyuania aurantiaca]QZD89436.1 MOSC domain-containing protein [Qipengyuania aurantiaca]
MKAKLLALCTGQPAPLPDGKISSIDKQVREGPVRIGTPGLEGDTQVDRKHHGGAHMAVHLYAADHYPYWREEIPEVDRLAAPGAFGENLHAMGLTEKDVFIGDRFRLGSALLELSMGRQPCSTLERHFQRKDMVKRIIANHRCGWYFRVLEEGEARADDDLALVERTQDRWSVDAAFALLFDPAVPASEGEIRDLLAIPALGPQWRSKLEAKLR